MPTHAEVAKSFWTRSARHWTDQEKLLGLYILSGPHSTSEGYYRLPLGYVVDDLGWETEQVSTTMNSLSEHGFVRYDRDAQVVFVCKRLEYRQPRGENQVRGALNAVRDVPPSPLLGSFIETAGDHAPEFGEALASTFASSCDTPSQGIAEPYPLAGARASGLSPTPTPTPNNSHVEPERLDEAKDRLRRGAVRRVFDAWIESSGRTGRTAFTRKRQDLIAKWLEVYSVDELTDAVCGWRYDPHNRGETNGTVYNDIELLLRDAAHIEKFRDLERASVENDTPEFLARMAARSK